MHGRIAVKWLARTGIKLEFFHPSSLALAELNWLSVNAKWSRRGMVD